MKLNKITLFGVTVSFSVKDYKLWAKTILLNYCHYKVFLSVLPFFIGGSQLLSSRYRNQIFGYLVDKNLPGLSAPYQKLSLETFDSKQLELFQDASLKQIDLYHDSILMQFRQKANVNSTKFFPSKYKQKNQKSLISSIENVKLVPHYHVILDSQKAFDESERVSIFTLLNQLASKKYYYYLDEFPSKIESFSNYRPIDTEDQIVLSDDDFFFDQNTEQILLSPNLEKKTTLPLSISHQFQIEKRQTLPYLHGVISSYQDTIKGQAKMSFQTPSISKYISSQGLEKDWNIQKRYYDEQNIFQNELKSFFYKNNLASSDLLQWNYSEDENSIELKKLIFNIDQFLEEKNLADYSSDQILHGTNLFSLIQNNSFMRSRKMSGYLYPDMDTSKVWSLGIQFYSQIRNFLGSSGIGIKIDLPPSYIFPSVYTLPRVKSPEFELKSRQILLTAPGFLGDIVYTGPALLKERKTHEIALNNRRHVQNWFIYYFGRLNPLTDRRDGFFGVNREKGEEFQKQLQNDFLTNERNLTPILVDKKEIKQKLHFKKTLQPSLFEYFPVIQTDEEVYIPFIENKDWKKIVEDDRKNFSLPFLVISHPSGQSIEWSRTQLDYQSNKTLFATIRSYIDRNPNFLSFNIHYPPTEQACVSDALIDKSRFDQIYKKIYSIYDQKVEPGFNLSTLRQSLSIRFYENWEPLTQKSWLFITQFSVALFLFKSLQEVYEQYGKELITYFLDLVALVGLVDDEVREILEDDETKKSYRILTNVKDRLTDFVGMEEIIEEFADVVWFLRNSGRYFKSGKIVPKGILLVGPPGTGKTLIARAVAGESQVPVLVESGSSLTNPNSKIGGTERLKMVFDRARELAPCILFIDEIDTLGRSRQNIMNQHQTDGDLFDLLHKTQPLQEDDENEFVPKPILEDDEFEDDPNIPKVNQALAKLIDKMHEQKRKITLLTQLLVELDGLQSRSGVLVIGATNRPDVLDPALLRPGRFDRKLELKLPGKEKRIEILKFYGERVGVQEPISWDYLANRTRYFSSADLAALMNESAMQAIFNNTIHTVETIEKGIDLITSYSTDKIKLKRKYLKDPFFLSRFAYYQAGKAVLHSILPAHPPAVILYLWPRVKNARHSRIKEHIFFDSPFRSNLESRLIGFYAGKAAEMFLIGSNYIQFSKVWMSDFGLEDIQYGSTLAYAMVDKWYLYSKHISTSRMNSDLISDKNEREIKFIERIEMLKVGFDEFLSRMDKESHDPKEEEHPADIEKWGYIPWWQREVAEQTGYFERAYSLWYRFQVYDPKKTKWNLEIIRADRHYHENNRLKSLSSNSSVNFNQLYEIDRDYLYHSLVMTSFNQAFCLLDIHRELLDIFADYLLRHEIIRQDEISKILDQYFRKYKKRQKITKQPQVEESSVFPSEKAFTEKTDYILDKNWGQLSRRSVARFINFQQIIQEKEKSEEEYYPYQIPGKSVSLKKFFPEQITEFEESVPEKSAVEESEPTLASPESPEKTARSEEEEEQNLSES